jgi:hypothetical protein
LIRPPSRRVPDGPFTCRRRKAAHSIGVFEASFRNRVNLASSDSQLGILTIAAWDRARHAVYARGESSVGDMDRAPSHFGG